MSDTIASKFEVFDEGGGSVEASFEISVSHENGVPHLTVISVDDQYVTSKDNSGGYYILMYKISNEIIATEGISQPYNVLQGAPALNNFDYASVMAESASTGTKHPIAVFFCLSAQDFMAQDTAYYAKKSEHLAGVPPIDDEARQYIQNGIDFPSFFKDDVVHFYISCYEDGIRSDSDEYEADSGLDDDFDDGYTDMLENGYDMIYYNLFGSYPSDDMDIMAVIESILEHCNKVANLRDMAFIAAIQLFSESVIAHHEELKHLLEKSLFADNESIATEIFNVLSDGKPNALLNSVRAGVFASHGIPTVIDFKATEITSNSVKFTVLDLPMFDSRVFEIERSKISKKVLLYIQDAIRLNGEPILSARVTFSKSKAGDTDIDVYDIAEIDSIVIKA